ncbi:MAG: hypothetical protein ACRC1J_05960, partial [Sandaracinobacteroides sp.]
MGTDREAGRSPEEESSGLLARAVLQRIADGDLPGGLELDPGRIAQLFGSSPAIAMHALEQLE